MLRAVAKIDVGLNFPTTGDNQDVAAGLTNFKLEEIYLYNTSNKLQAAPTKSKLSGTLVTATSIPAGTGVFGAAGVDPILYTRRAYSAEWEKSFMNEIYLAEHDMGSDTDRPNNTCIVVGARYGTSTAAITYYRIDLLKTTESGGVVTEQEYLPVLRNHRYKVNITSVHGRGYDTPLEAFNAMGVNTNLKVVITSDARLTNVDYDGQYMLGVDSATVNVDKRAHSRKQIRVNTNYTGGWKATVSSEVASWLKLIANDGLEVTTVNGISGDSLFTFKVAEQPASASAPRTGTITVQAGRLFMDITVTQSHIADIEIVGMFDSYIMDERNSFFTVKSNYKWRVKVEDEHNIVTGFDLSGGPNAAGTTFNFTLINDALLNYLHKDRTVAFTFYSEEGKFDEETVDIRCTDNFYLDLTDPQPDLWVYVTDQPTGKTWHVYANNNGSNNNIVAGPGESHQNSPPVDFSCAALPQGSEGNANPWRLPTREELAAISGKVRADGTSSARWTYYGFTSGTWYWSATTYTSNYGAAYIVIVSTGGEANDYKTLTNYRARCVRSK
jgi:hypothetical protein